MKHLKIFEAIDTWDKHPKFSDAVKKVKKQMKSGNVEGGNWTLDFLGDDYPQSLAFARRVIIRASNELNPSGI